MDFAEITYRRLNEEKKARALEILQRTNTLLKKWHSVFSDLKFRQVRNIILDKPEVLGGNLPPEQQAEFSSDVAIIRSIRHPSDEFGGRTVETAILQNYTIIAKKHAYKWAKNSGATGLSVEDFMQEAYMQIMESMFQWNSESGADLTTYLWWSLKNRMSNVVNQQGNMLSHLTNTSIKLLQQYQKAKAEMDCNASFDEIANSLDLAEDDRQHLSDILQRAVNESMISSDNDSFDGNCDYTGLRSDIDQDSTATKAMQEIEIKEILDKSNLTPMERELIEVAMNPYYGWQTDIGLKYVSKRTGRPFGRMRVSQILERAREKVSRVLSKQ